MEIGDKLSGRYLLTDFIDQGGILYGRSSEKYLYEPT